jgi:hypothetical protein
VAAAEPTAYLIRATLKRRSALAPGGATSILSGYVYKTESFAQAAAERLSNHWRTCEAVPVYERPEATMGVAS